MSVFKSPFRMSVCEIISSDSVKVISGKMNIPIVSMVIFVFVIDVCINVPAVFKRRIWSVIAVPSGVVIPVIGRNPWAITRAPEERENQWGTIKYRFNDII
jgi:hypothetical protein